MKEYLIEVLEDGKHVLFSPKYGTIEKLKDGMKTIKEAFPSPRYTTKCFECNQMEM